MEIKLTSEEAQERMNQFREALRRSGMKATPQRLEIFRQVVESDDHPDAETVYEGVRRKLPTVSLDTVYRTLRLLVELDQVKTLGFLHAGTRFDGDTSSHHHFVCTKCGMIGDLPCYQGDQPRVPDLAKALGLVKRIQVEFRGICWGCVRLGEENEKVEGEGPNRKKAS